MIPLYHLELGALQEQAMLDALRAGHLAGNGPECRLLEEQILDSLGGRGSLLAVSSGSAALEIACRLLGPEDEVLVPAFTFVTCATAVLRAGRRLRFCDVDPGTGCVSAETLAAAWTPQTRACMIVHYAGRPCEMEGISSFIDQHKLTLIEDAAHALGTRTGGAAAGTLGDFGCFSLHTTKEVPAGEGGLLWCRDPETAGRAMIFREKGTNRDEWRAGRVPAYNWLELGTSDTLADPLAALARSYLGDAEHQRQQREQRAGWWTAALQNIPGLSLPPPLPLPSVHNWHAFVVQVDPAERARWILRFAEAGVAAEPHYPPLHQSPWARAHLPPQSLPGVEYYAASLLRLPLHRLLSPERVDRVGEALRGWT